MDSSSASISLDHQKFENIQDEVEFWKNLWVLCKNVVNFFNSLNFAIFVSALDNKRKYESLQQMTTEIDRKSSKVGKLGGILWQFDSKFCILAISTCSRRYFKTETIERKFNESIWDSSWTCSRLYHPAFQQQRCCQYFWSFAVWR